MWSGAIRNRLSFVASTPGVALVAYAVLLHPLIAPLTGRPWVQAEVFGIAPDPTAIATLGVILAATRAHWHLLILPVIWCVISGLTLWTMESPEAPVPPLLAAAALVANVRKSLTFHQNPDG